MTYRCPICDRVFASERARFEHPVQTKTHESVSHLAEMRSAQRAIAIMSARMRGNSWLSRNRIGSKLKIDGRLTHCSKHIPHLPILFSLARRNDRVL